MQTESELIKLLKNSEGQFLERKQSFGTREVRQALVAFANSVPEGQTAVLFIGIGPDGQFVGVENADKCQRDVLRVADFECFPPVRCTPTVIRCNEVDVVAVSICFSLNRPHFAGHAYVRIGSETKSASNEQFNELIASRTDKARRIIREKGKTVSTLWKTKSNKPPSDVVMRSMMAGLRGAKEMRIQQQWDIEKEMECIIEHCDSFHVRLAEASTSTLYSAPLDNVRVDFDTQNKRTRLIIDNR